jgi:DNA topoisomerase-2
MEETNQENLSIEDKYKVMDEIIHILERPGMYIGSTYNELKKHLLYKPSENKIVEIENVTYNAGLIKLFDEVFTNSIDERRRKSKLFHIDEINVEVFKNGTIIISDNGGIPVVIHKETNVYLPVMIFGMLRTSSNYSSDRDGAGINGIGSKISNIYSKYFRVTTSDGKNTIDVQWSDNMRKIDFENVTPNTKSYHGSKFEYQIELSRFELSALDMSTIRIIQKRCIDGAAANPGLKINFKTDIGDGVLDSSWLFNSFEEFVDLHLDKSKIQKTAQHLIDDIVVTTNIGVNYSFVNGAVCIDTDGTHFKKVRKQITDKILEVLKKKDIELITENDIKNKISIFINASLTNPDYSSQTKEKLTSKIPTDKLKLTKAFLTSLETSHIVEELVDYYNIKYLQEEKKKLKKLNGLLKTTKSKKLITCSNKIGNNNELWLFEGTSAANGFETYRNPVNMACYQLRGKVKNTLNLSKEDIVNNIELREIIAVLGLQFNDPKGNLKNCKFGKIIFGTDMDHDGNHICGLLLTFFAKNFPELFIDGRIYRAISPIVIAAKGDNELFYYTIEEFEQDKKNLKGYELAYIKGLGSLEDHHYDQMLNNQRLMQFTIQENYMENIRVWFDKSTELRKEILLSEANNLEEIEIN